MAVSYTTTYNLTKPEVGASEDEWGGLLNTNFDNLDNLLDGTTAITGIDINSGTLDGVTIGGTTAGAGTFTNLTATGTTTLAGASTSADITFGDNNKAIFGAGSDLQIYHNGSNSYIDEAGTGTLSIRTNLLYLEKYTGEAMLTAVSDGAVTIYHDNAAKLATTSTGIDVTGTVTADGLTVDGNTVFSGGSLGGGGNSESSIAAGLSAGRLVSDAGTTNITAWNTTFNDDVIEISAGASANYVSGIAITPRTTTADVGEGVTIYRRSTPALNVDGNGDISFYEDTGTTPKFFWDASAERLGIGTTSPAEELDISADAPSMQLSSTNASGRNYGLQSQNSGKFAFYDGTAGANRMVIDSSGRVGIGTSSPALPLDVMANSGANALALRTRVGDDYSFLSFRSNDGTEDLGGPAIYRSAASTSNLLFYTANGSAAAERMRIDSSGNVGIGATVPEAKITANVVGNNLVARFERDSGGNGIMDIDFGNADANLRSDNGFTFSTDGVGVSGGTEAMRIDSSGNLLVGKTSTSNAVAGIELNSTGQLVGTFANGTHILGRNTTDGSILQFNKDGATVGSIGAESGRVFMYGNSTYPSGIRFGNNVLEPSNSSGTARDALTSLGGSSSRFKDLYLSGGVYLGGTGAANKLDDYEEGSFTPTYFGSTTAGTTTYGSLQKGKYTKVGDKVTVHIELSITSATGTGNVRIGGLPFSANSNYSPVGSVMTNNYDQTAAGWIVPFVANGGSDIRLYLSQDNSGWVQQGVDSSCSLYLTVTYFV